MVYKRFRFCTLESTEGLAKALAPVLDQVCPWCFVAKRSLDRAQERLRTEGLDFTVRAWRTCSTAIAIQ